MTFDKNSVYIQLINPLLHLQHVRQTWDSRHDKQKDFQSENQLLVFGYASKIFAPDEHSAEIAKNKHMIAWNEDYHLNLLIDR